jgi:hypothetical protein
MGIRQSALPHPEGSGYMKIGRMLCKSIPGLYVRAMLPSRLSPPLPSGQRIKVRGLKSLLMSAFPLQTNPNCLPNFSLRNPL